MPSSHSIRSNRTIDGPNSPITDPRFNVRAKYHFVKKTENSIGTIETRPAISAKKSFLFVSRRHSFSWNASSMRLTKSTGRQLAFVGSWSRKLDEEQVPPPLLRRKTAAAVRRDWTRNATGAATPTSSNDTVCCRQQSGAPVTLRRLYGGAFLAVSSFLRHQSNPGNLRKWKKNSSTN